MKHSNVWKRIVKQLNKDRLDLLEQLITLSEQRDTEQVRGRIKQIDDILEQYPLIIKNTDT